MLQRVLDVTILCQYLATESCILPSYASKSWTLKFYINICLHSPGYCLPKLQSPRHYNFVSISGYRVLHIAFLCFKVLDIKILCQYLPTESCILSSYASESRTLQFCVNIWLQSPAYCLPMLQSPWHYNLMPISGYLAMDICSYNSSSVSCARFPSQC